MQLRTLLGYVAGSAVVMHSAWASSPAGLEFEPVILAIATFPEENAFGQVVNGERNKIFVTVENQSEQNVTLKNIAGSFHHPETNALVKNITAVAYEIPLIEGTKLQLPYQFYSEFRPGDIKLNLWLEHSADGETYRVTAYDGIVTVVEPEVSIFDYKMLSTYLLVASLLGGLGYYAYQTFVPQQKKRKIRTPAVSAPVGTVTATGAGGYQEEWIPEHHLKKPKATRRTKSGGLTSGDETSGAELSGTEGRKRKGKK